MSLSKARISLLYKTLLAALQEWEKAEAKAKATREITDETAQIPAKYLTKWHSLMNQAENIVGSKLSGPYALFDEES